MIFDFQLGGSGGANEDRASGVVIQPDGKIVVAGLASGGLGLLRLLPNGDFDSTFTEGVVTQGLILWTTKDAPVATDANGRPEVHLALQNAPGLAPNIIVGAGNTIYEFSVANGNARRHPADHLHRRYPGSPRWHERLQCGHENPRPRDPTRREDRGGRVGARRRSG